MESLFYSVFHNKYLFNKIIEQIHNNDWVVYNNIDQIHINNRIKFKNIKSFKWMVNKNQIELLKCKLVAGEPIEFDSRLSIINGINDREAVFRLILKSKSIKDKYNIIVESLHLLDPVLLDIALNPPYSIPITESTLSNIKAKTPSTTINCIYNHLYKKLIKDSSNQININLITKLIQFIFNQFKENNFNYESSQKLSNIFNSNSNNRNNSNNNINNNYNSNNNLSSRPTKRRRRYKRNKPQPIYKLVSIPKLDIEIILFKIASIDTQITLLQNSLYQIPYYFQKHTSEINSLISNSNISSTVNSDNGSNSIKQHQELILNLINTIKPSMSESYLKSIIPLKSLLDLNSLKLLLDNNKNNWKQLNFDIYKEIASNQPLKRGRRTISRDEEKDEDKDGNISLDFKYIRYYLELEDQEELRYFRIPLIDKKINNQVQEDDFSEYFSNKISDNLEFKSFVEYIHQSKSNERVSSIKWINLIKMLSISSGDRFVIMDTETIDFIININKSWAFTSPAFEMNSMELLEYANRIDSNDVLFNRMARTRLFEELLLNGKGNDSIDKAIKLLKEGIDIDEAFVNIRDGISYSTKITIFKWALDNNKEIKKNPSKQDMFRFRNQLSRLVKYFSLFTNEKPTTSTNFIKDSGMDLKLVTLLFVSSFSHNKLEWFQLILSNLGYDSPVLCSEYTLDCFKNSNSFSSNDIKHSLLEDRYTDNKTQQVLDSIRFVLEYSSLSLNSTSTSTSNFGNQESIRSEINIKRELFELILNYLFKQIIKIKSATTHQAYQAYQLITNSNSFRVNLDPPSVFAFCLSIRSIKLIKYILESPLFDKERCYGQCLQVFGYIDRSKFSIDYLFDASADSGCNGSQSFDIILNQLIDQLSYQLLLNRPDEISNIADYFNEDFESYDQDESDYEDSDSDEIIEAKRGRKISKFITKLLNYNLEFLMDIHRVDLVLEHLEIIKSQFSLHYNSDQFQFSDRFIQQCNKVNLKINK